MYKLGVGPMSRYTLRTCPLFRGCPLFRVSTSGSCPLFRVSTSGGCPLFRVSTSGGCPLFRVSTSGGCPLFRVSTSGGCPLFRVSTSGVCPLFRVSTSGGCPLFRVSTSGGFTVFISAEVSLNRTYDTEVRLVQGNDSFPYAGYLEIYLNEEWGPVCNLGTDGSHSVCRQLGYTGAANSAEKAF